MVNPDVLTTRALRAYELGRLRVAARVLLVVVPVAVVCLLEQEQRGVCACCTFTLLALAVWLRWRSRNGALSVTNGLFAASVPLGFALLLARVDPGCATAGWCSSCTALSLVTGACAGVVVALRSRGSVGGLASVVGAAGVATITASLGCARLGLANVAGVSLGIVLGSGAVTRFLRGRSRAVNP